jgi:hypothetical protein
MSLLILLRAQEEAPEAITGTGGVIYLYDANGVLLVDSNGVALTASDAVLGGITAESATAQATGKEALTGTAAVTAEAATVEAVGAEAFRGSADITADAATLEAEGTVTAADITGTGAVEARQATTQAEGIVLADVSGTADVTARGASVEAVGIGGIVTEELPNLQAGSLSKRKPRLLTPISGYGAVTAQPAEVLAFGAVNDDELVLMLLVA